MKQKISPKLPEKAQKDPYKKSYSLLSELKLKPKQVKFIILYAEYNFDAKRAYIEAGYKSTLEKDIPINANEILKNPKVVEGLAKYLDAVMGPHRTVLEKQLFDVLFKRAFYSPEIFQAMFSEDGSSIDWTKLPEGYGVCIDGVETKCYGKEADIQKVVLKLANRDAAIDKLDKYIGMTKDTKVIELGEISLEKQQELAALFPGGKKK